MNSDNYIPREQILSQLVEEAINETPSGLLDGLTIFRFAHMARHATSGGVEAYLWNLNRVLLKRNRIRILQSYQVPEGEPSEVITETIGQGELVWIPSLLTTISAEQMSYAKRLKAKLTRRSVSGFRVNHEMLLSNLVSYQPRLGVFHWISEDSEAIIDHLSERGVPFAVINHFSNTRLKLRMIRKQISKARAIAGVSEADLPFFLRKRFTNLSDGMDVDFFHPQKAAPLDIKLEEPLILLPSRICEEKGQIDAVRALGLLAHSKVKAVLAFAGREGSQDFTKKLIRVISEEGVQERVIFVGELCPEDLRNWYAASDLVVLPSYSEGLPRVLLEAQAMERPVLAYDVGGVRETFQEGSSGLLVRKGDIRGLARRFQDLLADEGSRSAMGKRGRKFVVGRFSLDSLAIRHERFYANALNLSR